MNINQIINSSDKDKINALFNGYNNYVTNMTNNYINTINEIKQKQLEDSKTTFGDVIGSPLKVVYSTFKGLFKGIVDLVGGVSQMSIGVANNLFNIFKDEGRFYGANASEEEKVKGQIEEIFTDLSFSVLSPIIDFTQGGYSFVSSAENIVKNIFGTESKEEFNQRMQLSNDFFDQLRGEILLGEFDIFMNAEDEVNKASRKDKYIEEAKSTRNKWADIATEEAYSITTSIKNYMDAKLTPNFLQFNSKAGIYADEISQSIGRMIPAVASSYLNLPSWASQLYFFSSTFGSAFDDALSKGADIEDAYTYGYSNAMIETLTEQIGGIKLGEKLASKTAIQFIMNGINEGIEEVVSEIGASGLDAIIGEDASNEDFFSRAAFSFLGGAISSGVLGGAGNIIENYQYGAINKLNEELSKVDSKGENINEKIDNTIASLNRKVKSGSENAIKNTKALIENSYLSPIIEFNNETKQFELTKEGKLIKEDYAKYKTTKNSFSKSYSQTEAQTKIDEYNKKNNTNIKINSGDFKEASKVNIKDLNRNINNLNEISENDYKFIIVDNLENSFEEDGTFYISSKDLDSNSYIPLLTNKYLTDEKVNQDGTILSKDSKLDAINKEIAKIEKKSKLSLETRQQIEKEISFVANINARKNLNYSIAIDYDGKIVGENVEGFIDKKNGIVYINAKTMESLKTKKFIIAHELFHDIANTKDGKALSKLIIDEMIEKGTYDNLFKETEKIYKSNIKTKDMYEKLSDGKKKAYIEEEMVADFISENMFTNENYINKLVEEKQSFMRKVWNWIKNSIKSFGKSKKDQDVRTLLEKAEDIYLKAFDKMEQKKIDIEEIIVDEKNIITEEKIESGEIKFSFTDNTEDIINKFESLNKEYNNEFEKTKNNYINEKRKRNIEIDKIINSINPNDKSRLANIIRKFYNNRLELDKYISEGVSYKLHNYIADDILSINILNFVKNIDENTGKIKDINLFYKDLVDSISNSMAYTYNVFRSEYFKDPSNKLGLQYNSEIYKYFTTKGIELPSNIINVLNLYTDYIEDINFKVSDEEYAKTKQEFLKLIKEVVDIFDVKQINVINDGILSDTRETANITKLKIEDILNLNGGNVAISKDGKKKTIREYGLLGKNYFLMMDKIKYSTLDMYSFSRNLSCYIDNSLFNIMSRKITEAQIKTLEVNNLYSDYFDEFTKKNEKKIRNLETDAIEIKGLIEFNSKNSINLPSSQIIYLRDVLLREIIRNRLIEIGIRGGNETKHFEDNGNIVIKGNLASKVESEHTQIKAIINGTLEDLFLELDNIINKNEFMKEYNKMALDFFDKLYDYENIRYKDMYGLELTSDNRIIQKLSDSEKSRILDGLGDIDINRIYMPFRSLSPSKANRTGAFDPNTFIDLGINDGMVMGIKQSINTPLVDSINVIIPRYTKSVANYYGLYRVVNDLNVLFASEVEVYNNDYTSVIKQYSIEEYIKGVAPVEITGYYEKMIRDISGYGLDDDMTSRNFSRLMKNLKRNYYKATLGLNLKTIATQISSLINVGVMYGGKKISKSKLIFKMFGLLFDKNLSSKSKYLNDNSEIFIDRSKVSTFAIGEAINTSDIIKSKFDRITEMSLKGIQITDTRINQALFVALVESGYTNNEAMKMVEEGINQYQSSALASNKAELLRTEKDIIKIFMKFMGEPLKALSNITDSVLNLNAIKHYKQNIDNIKKFYKEKTDALLNRVNQINKNIADLKEILEKNKKNTENLSKRKASINKENRKLSKNINDENAKKIEENNEKINNINKNIDDIKEENKTFRKLLSQNEREKTALFDNYNKIKNHNDDFISQVDNILASESNVKETFAKRVTALSLALSWQTALGILFGFIRKTLPEKEDEESTISYVSELVIKQFLSEAIGYMPFVKDFYNTIINGYDLNKISEIDSINNIGTEIYSLFNDIVNGGKFNYLKHLRNLSISIGNTVGVPVKQIERIFTSSTNYIFKDMNYIYKKKTGQYIPSNTLNKAIASGNERLVEAIVNNMFDDKDVTMTEAVMEEINRLYKNNIKVVINKNPDVFSIDNVEYTNDKDKFNETYQNANYVLEKIIKQTKYKGLKDYNKAKIIKSVFNYYYNLAKQNVSGVEIYPKERNYTLNQAYNYFSSVLLTLYRDNK